MTYFVTITQAVTSATAAATSAMTSATSSATAAASSSEDGTTSSATSTWAVTVVSSTSYASPNASGSGGFPKGVIVLFALIAVAFAIGGFYICRPRRDGDGEIDEWTQERVDAKKRFDSIADKIWARSGGIYRSPGEPLETVSQVVEREQRGGYVAPAESDDEDDDDDKHIRKSDGDYANPSEKEKEAFGAEKVEDSDTASLSSSASLRTALDSLHKAINPFERAASVVSSSSHGSGAMAMITKAQQMPAAPAPLISRDGGFYYNSPVRPAPSVSNLSQNSHVIAYDAQSIGRTPSPASTMASIPLSSYHTASQRSVPMQTTASGYSMYPPVMQPVGISSDAPQPAIQMVPGVASTGTSPAATPQQSYSDYVASYMNSAASMQQAHPAYPAYFTQMPQQQNPTYYH
ncbi:uncharacterized protein V1518DRAFT_407344 [Limtongia smithiae]|uniref:uncharacterized protein n=1 Tax=Limtongia smithiae TaxID=1125753 RepID=UPI0034CF9986